MDEISRIESEFEVKCYLQDLSYALDNGAKIWFQTERIVDNKRAERFTNKYTVAQLFPNEDPVIALKRELKALVSEDYIRTVKDLRFPKRSEMREFGKVYNSKDDVYIKIRVELFDPRMAGAATAFIMSFHFAETAFDDSIFPYKKR